MFFMRNPINVLTAGILSLILSVAVHVHSAAAEEQIWDPIEPVNRGIFWFNDKFDYYIFEPAARGYDWAVPDPVQEGVGNFFDNLKYPSYLVSDIVQFKFTQAAEHTGRFVLNSTIGIVGILDVAKHVGLERHQEDFGIALAYHDVPPGPYIVIPILGPSNLRDGFGRIVDSFLDPLNSLAYAGVDEDIAIPVIIGARVLDGVDTRANLLEAIDTAKESSLDYYLFMQGAYYQYRRGVLYDGDPPDEEEEEIEEETGAAPADAAAIDPNAPVADDAIEKSEQAEEKVKSE